MKAKPTQRKIPSTPEIIDNSLVNENSSRTGEVNGRKHPPRKADDLDTMSRTVTLGLSAKAVTAFIACFLCICIFALALRAAEDRAHLATHSIRGRILLSSSDQSAPVKVSLSRNAGEPQTKQEQKLGYDGSFSYKDLPAGKYLLTIESPDLPTIVRAVELKDSIASTVAFLTIRIGKDGSATIHEAVTEDTGKESFEPEDSPTQVSKKAFKEFQKAAEEGARGNHAGAVGYLKKAIAEQPNYFEAYNNLGVQYQKLNRLQDAVEAYSKAAALRSQSIRPQINLGTVYLNLGQVDTAIQHFQTALDLNLNSVPAHLGLGQAFFQKKDLASAEEHLETATRIDPRGTKQAFLLLIQIQIVSRKYDRAQNFLAAMAQFFPNDPDVSRLSASLHDLSDNPSIKP